MATRRLNFTCSTHCPTYYFSRPRSGISSGVQQQKFLGEWPNWGVDKWSIHAILPQNRSTIFICGSTSNVRLFSSLLEQDVDPRGQSASV